MMRLAFLILAARGLCEGATIRLHVEDAPGMNHTASVQALLDGNADTLVLTAREGGWNVGPLFFRRNNRILILMPGCVLRASVGGFPRENDRLLTLKDVENVAIVGYSAKIVMRKSEYLEGEGRHAISIRGSRNIRLEGLTIDSSGGDGIYVAGNNRGYSEGIRISHCLLRGHRRQGISVISAADFILEHSRIEGTLGTAPQAGIDFEPNYSKEKLVNCQIRNLVSLGNRGAGGKIHLGKLRYGSDPASITFRDCYFSGTDSGKAFEIKESLPVSRRGLISFERCLFYSASNSTFWARKKGPKSTEVRFDECEFRARKGTGKHIENPVFIITHDRKMGLTATGKFAFKNCVVNAPFRMLFPPEISQWDRPNIQMSIYLTEHTSDFIPYGIEMKQIAKRPEWNPPPPFLGSIKLRLDEVSFVLGNWSGDSVEHRIGLKPSRRVPSGTSVSMLPGQTLSAFSIRGNRFSDTLSWLAPGYLGVLSE